MEERVDIKGMNCSRWRCCECFRGLSDNNWCDIHGTVEPIDILVDEDAQITACEIRLSKVGSVFGDPVEHFLKYTDIDEDLIWVTIRETKDR